MGRTKKEVKLEGVPENLVQLGNSTTFKLKISDCGGIISPKELDNGLFVLLEASSSNSLTFEFNIAGSGITCKIFTEDQKGYPEKFEFTPSQFARMLRGSNKKSKNPLDEEKDLFASVAKAKVEKAEAIQAEQEAPVKRRRRRKLT